MKDNSGDGSKRVEVPTQDGVREGDAHAWALVRFVALLWRRARFLNRQLAPQRWRRVGGELTLGVVVASAATWLVTIFARWLASGRMDEWDRSVLDWVVNSGTLSFVNAILFESPANLLYLIPLCTGVAVLAILRGHLITAALAVSGYVFARVYIYLGWNVWHRERPSFVANGMGSPDWPSDVVGGWVIGLIWLAVVIVVHERHEALT